MPDYPRKIASGAFAIDAIGSRQKQITKLKVQRSKLELQHLNLTDTRTCGVTSLKVVSIQTGAASSGASVIPTDAPQDYLADAPERFCFAPKEEDLTVQWEFRNPSLVQTAVLELFRDKPGGAAERLWAKEITWDPGKCPAKVETRLNGNLSRTRQPKSGEESDIAKGGVTGASAVRIRRDSSDQDFPDKYLTIEHSPYQLRVTITEAQVDRSPAARWIFLDVLAKIDLLLWGEAEMIPGAWVDAEQARNQVQIREEEIAILRGFHNTTGGNHAVGAGDYEVVIGSNAFKEGGLDDDHHDFDETTKIWGLGPRLPIVATILIRRSDGTFVDDPVAIGNAKFLWDWEDQPNVNATPKWQSWDPAALPATQNFLRGIVNKFKDPTDPLESDNCPVELGGNRHKDNPKSTFPIQSGYDPTDVLQEGAFPFTVTACTNRKWAGLSQAWRTGLLKGKTGVLFQPSRIAGDHCKLCVYLYYDAALDNAAPKPAVLRANAGPDIHRFTGYLKVFRRIDVHYIRRAGAAALNTGTMENIYRNEAGMILNVTPHALDEGTYGQLVGEAAESLGSDHLLVHPYLNLFLRYGVVSPQTANSPAVDLKPSATFQQDVRTAFRNNQVFRIVVPNPNNFWNDAVLSPDSGAKGIIVKRDATSLFVLSTNATAFAEGNSVIGKSSGAEGIASEVRNSCWDKTITPAAHAQKGIVEVGAGGATTTIRFGTLRRTMKDGDRRQVLDFLVQAAANNPPANTLDITVAGIQGGTTNTARRQEVVDYVTSIFTDGLIVEKRLLLQHVEAANWYNGFSRRLPNPPGDPYPDIVIFKIMERALRAYVDIVHKGARGVFFFHFPGRDSQFNVKSTGASFPASSRRQHGLVYLGTWPNAGYVTTRADGSTIHYKNDDSVAAHELGHALFLAHAKDHAATGRRPGPPLKPVQHVLGGTCIMNYDSNSDHFCGFCMLRLRGWDWQHFKTVRFGVRNLRISDLANSIQSVAESLSPDDYPEPAVGAADFHFAPQNETTRISYDIDDPDGRITSATLELLRVRDGHLLHTWNLAAGEYTHGPHATRTWDGTVPVTADFPDGFITLEHSPYRLRVTVCGDGFGDPAYTMTKFEVQVEEIVLEWGPPTVLAASPNLFNTGTQRDIVVYNKLAVANDPQNLGNALPAPGETKRVYLLSNDFYTNVAQQIDNTGYDRHLLNWGFGPNIPIFANVLIRRCAAGPPVNVPVALGNAQFLWDWKDAAEDPDPGGFAHDIDYLEAALDYKPVALPDYPDGNNCHEDRGGKRGANHPHPIFPPQAGTAPGALVANQFPFPVVAGANRTWAAISTPWRAGAAQAAGKSGVIFNPSRMAGDAYTLEVCLFYTSICNPDQAGAPHVAALAKLPASYKVKSGRFEIWREVDIVHHMQKTANLDGRAPATQAGFDEYYDPVYFKVRLAPLVTANPVDYNNAVQAVAAAVTTPPYIRASIDPGVDQVAAGSHGIQFRGHASFQGEIDLLAGAAGRPALFAGFAPIATDPYTNAPLWKDEIYASPAGPARGDYWDALNTKWPRMLVITMLEHYFNPVPDGVIILEVAMLYGEADGSAGGPRGFAVHFWVPRHHSAPIVLCADSPPETAAHELGHLLFLNHVHKQRGDKFRFHNHFGNGEGCVMSYVKNAARKFCGSCQLRLRGWSLYEVNNTAAGTYGANRTLWPIAADNRHPPVGGPPALPPPYPAY